MKYERVLAFVAGTPWAIEPLKAEAILSFLAFKAAGGYRSETEIAALVDSQASAQPRSQNGGGVAVIGLRGVISPRIEDAVDISGPGGTSAEGFAKRIEAADADTNVGRIVIDGNSPGGSVFGVPEAAAAVAGASKPVTFVANSLAASAAYWIASQADELVVSPSSEVGSIGVYAYHEDMSKRLESLGVTPTLIRAKDSPNKAGGHPAFPLSKDAHAALQDSVDTYMQMFLEAVASGRGVSVATVKEQFGGGRMFTAREAVARGMADRIATLDQVIAEARSGGGRQPQVESTVGSPSARLELRRRRVAFRKRAALR
jgi:signal peptide peptidase SppA